MHDAFCISLAYGWTRCISGIEVLEMQHYGRDMAADEQQQTVMYS